jgi:hypothetical protein
MRGRGAAGGGGVGLCLGEEAVDVGGEHKVAAGLAAGDLEQARVPGVGRGSAVVLGRARGAKWAPARRAGAGPVSRTGSNALIGRSRCWWEVPGRAGLVRASQAKPRWELAGACAEASGRG